MAGDPTRRRSLSHVALFLLCALVGGLYAPGLRVGYYGDDFWSFFPEAPPSPAHYFLHTNPYNPWYYRPLEATFLSHVQSFLPGTTLPIHLTGLWLHTMVCWVLLLGLKRLGLSARAACLAAVFMAVSQANVSAALGNDTLSQVGSTLFGSAGLFLILGPDPPAARSDASGPSPSGPMFLWSVVAFASALFSKETGFFFLPLLLGALLIRPGGGAGPAQRYRSILRTLPFLALALLYLWARARVGLPAPRFGSGSMELQLGLNLPVNALFLATVALLPASSTSLIMALRSARYERAAGMGIFAAGCLALILWGIARSPRRRPVVWMLIAAAMTVAPACLLERTSEVHLYSAMPFVAAIFGVAFDRCIDAARGRPARRLAAAAIVVAILGGEAAAARSKIGMMRRNGERAAVQMRQLVSEIATASPQACVCVLRPSRPAAAYAVFVVPAGDLLYAGGAQIKILAGRPDVDLRFSETEAGCLGSARACRIFAPAADGSLVSGG